MHRITSRAAAEIRALPGVREVGGHVGRAITSDQVAGSGSGEMWVTMKGSADYGRTLAAIRGVVAGYPGVRSSVLTYEGDRMSGVLARGDNGLTVRMYGQDLGVLDRQAQTVRRTVAQVDGVRNARVQPVPVQPTMQIKVNLEAARRHDIKPGDVRRAAAILVQGLDVGAFFQQQKVFQVVVRGRPELRQSIDTVRNLRIDAPDGTQVRLGDVASVAVAPNPVDLRHDAVSRYVDVRAAVSGRGVDAVRADVRDRLRAMHLPLDYHAEVVTPSADEQSPLSAFLALAAAAAVGIYLLLQAAFGSWRLASLVFATLPTALVGGLVVIVAGGGDLSLGAAFGLMTVLGIAVRNAVMLVRHLQGLEANASLDAALVVRGTADRAAPVALTALVMAAALLPFAVLGDVAGNEITHSTAAVVIGGLVTSTVLSLFVLPALYLHLAHGAVAARAERAETAPVARPRHACPESRTEGKAIMQLDKRTRAAVAAAAVALAVAGCGKAETFNNEAASDEGPSRLEQVKGSDLPRVVLTAKAAQRIGIETSVVRHGGAPGAQPARDPEVIPYAAVVYDAEGHAFTYVRPRQLTFERTPIRIVRTDGTVRRDQQGAARRHAGRDRRRPGAPGRRVRRRRGLTRGRQHTMRWIVGSSLRFRFLVVAAAAALDVLRRGASSRTRRWTSSRSSRPPRVEIQTACLGLSAVRGRGARDRAARGRAERRARAST